MNFYKRFIGDIQAKTGGLSLAEFGAYDRLLDHYYSTEQPIEAGECYRICRAMSKDERMAVDRVLARFFELGEGGYSQSKADEVIAKALPLIEAARANGKKGGRPKKPITQQKPSGFEKETQQEPSAKAIQSQSQLIHSEPNGSGGEPPDFRALVFSQGVPLLTAAGVVEKNARSMLAGLSKLHGEQSVYDAIVQTAKDGAGEPVAWLQKKLAKDRPATSKHAGFASKNYREGIAADGSFT